MNIVVIGAGYVGLVTGCCLAEAGNRVICVDSDLKKIKALEAGHLPFYEPQLGDLLTIQRDSGRLIFEVSIEDAVEKADIVFLAVGTPANEDGSADLKNLLNCAKDLARVITSDCIVVVKSTVPVGTGEYIEKILNQSSERADRSDRKIRIRIASNPEFLAEGRAVQDFRHPDRIVIGAADPQCFAILEELYEPFDYDGQRLIFMDVRSAEFAKYACNSMLAARISMINELSGLAGALGAEISSICQVLEADPRIGGSYLHPGVGYGGSCLPKDLSALIYSAKRMGEPADMLRSIQRVNLSQRDRLLDAIREHFMGDLSSKKIAVWGLSFKPGTNDVRAAPSLTLIRDLVEDGACVHAYDPVAQQTANAALAETEVGFGKAAMDVCKDADALVVMTEWDEFKRPDFNVIKRQMRGNMIFDSRALYRPETLRKYGLKHYRLGQKRVIESELEEETKAGRPFHARSTRETSKEKHPG
ncbi:UDP-glucose 6-dehydrogenase [Advenella kashmirensis W13003]|uniref:UDP-glucose 6-dehydrogenase n=1 Tax=Advenella kashmirensis W13003 TaxID=1424334 RepID=V8QW03_9BURK|nr:UDP-glucose/GDP-mannose dehydrogenase family protein [Advenella kashmirensis]ETF03837.1 UDP-glucose 6-dehydrogenase [Advenella kashmirensis W13003]